MIDGPGTDQVADLLDPLPDNLVEIRVAYVGHFLEHLSQEEGVTFLQELRERMVSGGLLVVVGPDVERATSMFKAGAIPKDLYEATLAHGYIPEGEPHNRGAIHMWDCTGHDVVDMLEAAGWVDAHEFPVNEMNKHAKTVPLIDGGTWQFAALAYAPAYVQAVDAVV